MATEKKIVDGSEKKEEDVNPNEVEGEDLEEEADKVGEKAEEPGKECGDEEEEKADLEDDELKEEKKDEAEEDEEKADREDDEMREEDEDETKDEEEADVEEKDEEKKAKGEEESVKKIEMSKKRSRKQTKNETGVLGSPRTPGSERPTRERKTVERFMLRETPRASASKTLSIEKGQGTQLKDIPNVAFKLSKRKADENLQLLHSILFGKKSKVHTLKKNLGLFSGFVWVENEEKQRAKIKDRIEKCVKEKLVDFCDILNIHVNKTTTKKEEISAKLLEFLESPHSTTESLLADKEKKGKKRKSSSSTSKSPSFSSVTARNSKKKQKLDAESGKKAKHSTGEDDSKSESSPSEEDHDDDSIIREAESDNEELQEGTDEDEPKKSGKKDTGKTMLKSKPVGKGSDEKTSKTTKKPLSSTSKKEAEPVSKRKSKAPLSKKKKDEEESEKDKDVPTKRTSSSKKKSSKSSDKKERGKGKSTKEPEKQPSREEMHSAVVDMLKEVDFNTVTLSDILRQLGKHFEVDLMHRKTEVKEIITEVIESMSDDEEGEEAEAGDESGKGGDDE